MYIITRHGFLSLISLRTQYFVACNICSRLIYTSYNVQGVPVKSDSLRFMVNISTAAGFWK